MAAQTWSTPPADLDPSTRRSSVYVTGITDTGSKCCGGFTEASEKGLSYDANPNPNPNPNWRFLRRAFHTMLTLILTLTLIGDF